MLYNYTMEILAVDNETKYSALKASPYFKELPSSAISALSANMSLRGYTLGEVICWQGDPCSGLYILKSGSVKLFKLSPRGRELIITTFSDGAVFNEVPVFDGGLNAVNVAALGDVEIWQVDQHAILTVMAQYPELCRSVVQSLATSLRMLVNKLEELSFFQVTNRLARLITQMPVSDAAPTMREGMTQDQMAARLGTVREVVARSLRDLERSGAIRVRRRQIQVLNSQILQDWAQDPPA